MPNGPAKTPGPRNHVAAGVCSLYVLYEPGLSLVPHAYECVYIYIEPRLNLHYWSYDRADHFSELVLQTMMVPRPEPRMGKQPCAWAIFVPEEPVGTTQSPLWTTSM
jgi:hypothetical protein